MRRVLLKMEKQEKYEVIKELVDHDGNKNRVSKKLNLSKRQVNRLIIKYKERGKEGFMHGNRSRKPKITFDTQLSMAIINLYKNIYYDFNFTHFHEFLEKRENIKVSYRFVYNLLTKEKILSPKAKKYTKREYFRNKLKEETKIIDTSPNEELEMLINHEINIHDSHLRQEKPKYFGEIIEMDGSNHRWFNGIQSCLHLAVDKATNTVVGAWFDDQETLKGYYNVFYQILKNYGIPYGFFTDNRTIFNYIKLNPDKKTSDCDVFTQFAYACKQLGVGLETSSVSQAKGLVERINETFQGRLENITTIEKANDYLLNVFVPNCNKLFSADFRKFESIFEKSPDKKIIDYTLAVLTPKKIDNGNAIKFKNKYYQPYLNNEEKCFKPKTECLVIKSFKNSLLVTIDDKVYELRGLNKNALMSDQFDDIKKENSQLKQNTFLQ